MTSLAVELDRADPRISSLTPLRSDVLTGLVRLSPAERQERRREQRRRAYRA
jgi:hypothetical protein